jgi:urease accessory protein
MIRRALTIGLFLAPALAQAHPGHAETSGFAAGLAHPAAGLDHLLAMVAVGMWGAQLGGRSVWIMPAVFLAAMAIGGGAGMAGIALPGVALGILASVLVLGVLLAAAVRLPLGAGALAVGLFAIFHGAAHGAEMPAESGLLAYCAGFLIATALLHAAGIGLGLAAQKIRRLPALRFAGAALVAAGVLLAAGII